MFRKYVLGEGLSLGEYLFGFIIAGVLAYVFTYLQLKIEKRKRYMQELGYLHSDGLQA